MKIDEYIYYNYYQPSIKMVVVIRTPLQFAIFIAYAMRHSSFPSSVLSSCYLVHTICHYYQWYSLLELDHIYMLRPTVANAFYATPLSRYCLCRSNKKKHVNTACVEKLFSP